jgi:hypothetical protein
MGLVLLLGLAGAALSAVLVTLMLRGRTQAIFAWAGGAIVCFYAVGNLMNRVVFPAIFGDQLELLLQHKQPVWSILEQTLASWAVAFVVTLALGAVVRWRTGRQLAAAARPTAPPQLVGGICAVCGERIVVEPDGTRCSRCRTPLHAGCAAEHTCAGV